MTLKGILDRKLIMLVVGPLVRRLGTALAVYLASRGVPADLADQLLTALAALLGLTADIWLATGERKKAELKGEQRALQAYFGADIGGGR